MYNHNVEKLTLKTGFVVQGHILYLRDNLLSVYF